MENVIAVVACVLALWCYRRYERERVFSEAEVRRTAALHEECVKMQEALRDARAELAATSEMLVVSRDAAALRNKAIERLERDRAALERSLLEMEFRATAAEKRLAAAEVTLADAPAVELDAEPKPIELANVSGAAPVLPGWSLR